MTFTLWLVFLASFVLLCKLFSKREGYYSTVAVFGIGCYLYYVGVPVELAWIDDPIIRSSISELGMLSVFQINIIIFLGIVALWSFALGYRLSAYDPFVNRQPGIFGSEIPKGFFIIVFVASVLLLIFFRGELGALGTYSGSSQTIYTNPEFSLLCTYVYVTMAIIGAVLLTKNSGRKKLAGVGILFSLIWWGVRVSDKDPLLMAILGFGVVFSGYRGKSLKILLYVIVGVIAAMFSFVLFSIYRGGGDVSDIEKAFTLFGLRYLDPGGPMLSIADSLESVDNLRFGSTYFDFFKLIIPRAIWSERPLDLSEAYAISKMTGWSEGKGYAFSPLAEAIMNFSFLGVFVQYLMFGYFWGLFWKYLRRLLWHIDASLWPAFYGVLGYYILIVFHRTPISGTLKTMFQTVIIISFLTLLFDQVFYLSRRCQVGKG